MFTRQTVNIDRNGVYPARDLFKLSACFIKLIILEIDDTDCNPIVYLIKLPRKDTHVKDLTWVKQFWVKF